LLKYYALLTNLTWKINTDDAAALTATDWLNIFVLRWWSWFSISFPMESKGANHAARVIMQHVDSTLFLYLQISASCRWLSSDSKFVTALYPIDYSKWQWISLGRASCFRILNLAFLLLCTVITWVQQILELNPSDLNFTFAVRAALQTFSHVD
jgi:hypothetical protein